MNDTQQDNLEQRLRKLKPKIQRDLRRELLAELPPPHLKMRFAGTLLACSCSFLLGLAVMYGVMKPPVAEEQQAQPQPSPAEKEEKPSRFSDDSVAAKPKETPSPKITAGNDYTYLSLLRKYQTP